MNKTSLRQAFSAIVLFALLPGCNNPFKDSCKSCGSKASLTGEALLTVNGKPVITTSSFEKEWTFLEKDPQASIMLAFMPNAKEDYFNNQMVPFALVEEWLVMTKKDRDAEFIKEKERQHEILDRALAFMEFQKEVVNSIDVSDAALRTFYEQEKDKQAQLQQPPFVKSAAGVKVASVQFSSEKQANDFAQKARKGGNFNTLAKEEKKEVKDLGMISNQSRNVDAAVKIRALEMKPQEVEVVQTGKNQYMVIKVTAKQEAEYVPFEEVNKENLKQIVTQIKAPELLQKKLDDLKNQMKVEIKSEYFEKEKKQKAADLEAQFKAMQEQQEQSGEESETQQMPTAAKAA